MPSPRKSSSTHTSTSARTRMPPAATSTSRSRPTASQWSDPLSLRDPETAPRWRRFRDKTSGRGAMACAGALFVHGPPSGGRRHECVAHTGSHRWPSLRPSGDRGAAEAAVYPHDTGRARRSLGDGGEHRGARSVVSLGHRERPLRRHDPDLRGTRALSPAESREPATGGADGGPRRPAAFGDLLPQYRQRCGGARLDQRCAVSRCLRQGAARGAGPALPAPARTGGHGGGMALGYLADPAGDPRVPFRLPAPFFRRVAGTEWARVHRPVPARFPCARLRQRTTRYAVPGAATGRSRLHALDADLRRAPLPVPQDGTGARMKKAPEGAFVFTAAQPAQ